jgi:hypothetical protein
LELAEANPSSPRLLLSVALQLMVQKRYGHTRRLPAAVSL